MSKKTLVVHATGATTDEIARCVAAVQRVFDDAGVTPWQAAVALFDRDGWDIQGFPEPVPSRDTFQPAEVWMTAEAAAYEVCCAGGKTIPDFELAVIDDDKLPIP